MEDKKLETIVIITLLLVICCFLFPIVLKIINNGGESFAETNVSKLVDDVKALYMSELTTSTDEVTLPFTVEYNESGYKTYYAGSEVTLINKLKISGTQPTSGKITWETDDGMSVTNLKYKEYICNKTTDGNIKCVKDEINNIKDS